MTVAAVFIAYVKRLAGIWLRTAHPPSRQLPHATFFFRRLTVIYQVKHQQRSYILGPRHQSHRPCSLPRPRCRGEDEFDQLVRISRVLGTDGLYAYAERYGVEPDPRLTQLCGVRPRTPWDKFVTSDNEHLCSPEGFDLLDRLLCYDHQERATCAEALAHPFFEPLRAAATAAASS